MAQRLKQAGFARVRPLAGGLQAWKDLGYEMEDVPAATLAEDWAQRGAAAPD